MHSTPWNLIRSFLEVVNQGSLSAAARELDFSQAKLSRDIQTLESHTKLNLFKRTTKGLQLTASGKSLVESAKKMKKHADHFNLKLVGAVDELKGDIRISVNEIVGLFYLPSLIAAFSSKHPEVNIDVVITNKASSISKREADIALCMFRPIQIDLVAKRLCNMPLGFYAHDDYINLHGIPESYEDIKNHTIIGFDESLEFIEGAKSINHQFVRDDFKIRTDNLIMQINLARNAAGIVVSHKNIMKNYADMQEILKFISLPALPLWLVCHVDSQYNAKIREFRRFIVDWFLVKCKYLSNAVFIQ